MKRLTFVAALIVLFQASFAGGLLTNTNQSSQFIRMMSRNASLGIDAVYFNPAGLVKMEEGWHFAVYNQSIYQTKTVDCKYPLFEFGAYQVSEGEYEPNDGIYEGVVKVPVFPTAFAVYKEDNWAFSLGFGPNGGGGSAEFERGLPSFEMPISKLVPNLNQLSQIDPSLSVTGYSADLFFTGSSVFWGIQLGATYKLSDMLSVYGGVRYLPSKNSYQGSINSIQIQSNGEYVDAPLWVNDAADIVEGVAGDASDAAAQLTGTANNLNDIIDQGGGTFTLSELSEVGKIDPSSLALLEGTLAGLGYTSEQIEGMNLGTIYSTFLSTGEEYSNQADFLNKTASDLKETADELSDKEVDVDQTGTGITPMIGVNISPSENWNIGLKYEMKTNLKLTNKTKVDDMGLFPPDEPFKSDIPAILAAGLGYSSDPFEVQLSCNMYFNKGVFWGPNTQDAAVWKGRENAEENIREREIESNGMEIGLGLQYNATDDFAFSLGGLYGDMGVAESYQSDFSYSNPSFSVGAGIEWLLADGLILDAGVSNTFYQDQTVSFTDPDIGSYSETLGKTTMTIAIGLSYSIF